MNENNLKPLPISNTENVQESKLEKLLKQYWSSIIAYLISIFGGCVVGLSTRSFHEGIIYSSIFVVESIICAIIGLISKDNHSRSTFFNFIKYFAIVAMFTILSTIAGFYLT